MTLQSEPSPPGAILEKGVPAVYAGGTEAEYLALLEDCGLLDLSDRSVLVVEGPERLGFLQRILSQEVKSLKDGEGGRAALMDPKGHIRAVVRMLVTSDSVDLEVSAESRPRLLEELLHYKVGTPVRFRARDTAIVGLLGPKAKGVLESAGIDGGSLPAEGHGRFALEGLDVRIGSTSDLPGGGYVVHAKPEDQAGLWKALLAHGAKETGRRAVDLVRIERGCPWFPQDIGPENLLHETGLVKALHGSQKGCYIGQEVVARLEARGGHVNKVLRGLRLGAPAAPGSSVDVDGANAGTVTSAGESPRLGPVALAYVKRPFMDAGTKVLVSSSAATVVVLPFPEP